MANNCVSNFRIVADCKEPLKEIADTLNSIRTRFPKVSLDENWWGQTWLGNLATLLGHDVDTFDGEMRGFLDPEFEVYPCLSMCGEDISEEPFSVIQEGSLFVLAFSVISAWYTPDWILEWLVSFENKYQKENLTVAFRATDEFNGFHTCRHPENLDFVYEVEHEDGNVFSLGDEQKFLECISRITGIPLTSKMKTAADEKDFNEILSLVNDWNDDHDDEECFVHVYTEN